MRSEKEEYEENVKRFKEALQELKKAVSECLTFNKMITLLIIAMITLIVEIILFT